MSTLVAVIDNLLFQSRVRDAASALGYETTVADTPAALRDALAAAPSLAVLDLHISALDWQDAVATANEASVPVLAFGRHTEPDLLRAARDAGCARVVPRSTLVEKLGELIGELSVP